MNRRAFLGTPAAGAPAGAFAGTIAIMATPFSRSAKDPAPKPSPTISELVERHRAYLAAYSAAPINSEADEKVFLATADTEAGDILDIDPPPIASQADLIAALQYIADDTGFAQEAHVRLLRSSLAYLEGRS